MTTAIFDIETTAIPTEGVYAVDKIHCIAIKVDDNPTQIYTAHYLPGSNGTLNNALEVLNSVDLVIAHNGIGFDCIVVNNVLGKLHTPCLDTMLLAKLIYTKDELIELDYTIPDFNKQKYGSFSLEAFGDRMSYPKGSHSDWSKLTTSMMQYCVQDVDVTYQLYKNLLSAKNFPSKSVIDLEHKVAAIIAEQVHYGFYYDIDNGRALMQKLMHEQLSISIRLSRTFKPLILRKAPDVTPAKPRRTKQYVLDDNYKYLTAIAYHPFQYTVLKNKKIRFKKYTWFTAPHRIVYTIYSGGDYSPVELTKFDPGSRHKIRHWLKQMYNFEFNTYTDKGNAKVNGDELEFLGDSAKDLMRYLKLTKDISEVRGILDIVKEHSHSVHGRVDTLGAATHRCTHSSPNVAQTSQDSAFRKLYTAPPGMVLVGADLANIEVRVLAHYLYPYDGGLYASAVLSKDMHWYHSGIAGFSDPDAIYDEHDPSHKAARNKSKTFFFG
jgi:DNA polymerase I-like protein with 3'-5' exonuclease and polymerase domains